MLRALFFSLIAISSAAGTLATNTTASRQSSAASSATAPVEITAEEPSCTRIAATDPALLQSPVSLLSVSPAGTGARVPTMCHRSRRRT